MISRSLACHRLLSPDANSLEVCNDVESHGVRQAAVNLCDTFISKLARI